MALWVSIEQDECTACGACPEYAPETFFTNDSDGLAYVREAGTPIPVEPEVVTITGLVRVRDGREDEVKGAEEDCPGECIHTFEE